MRGAIAFVACACCIAILACAEDSKRSGVAPMPPTDPHHEIEQLSAQIESQRLQMGLAAPPAPMAGAAGTVAASSKTDPKCHPAASAACTDSCTLADTICDDAAKICELAQQLSGDDWAAQKCSAATATCNAAHDKCCSCQL